MHSINAILDIIQRTQLVTIPAFKCRPAHYLVTRLLQRNTLEENRGVNAAQRRLTKAAARIFAEIARSWQPK